MKTIELGKHGKSFFYKVDYLTKQASETEVRGVAELTGMYQDEINVGDILEFNYIGKENHVVLEVMERRDCKGVFSSPDMAKGSFFRVKTEYSKPKTR